MKHFIFGLIKFVVFFLILAVITVLVSCMYMRSVRFEIPDDKNILVVGDSHTECAIDDTEFRRAINFSKSATSYLFTFAGMKKLIRDNPQVDTVLLSYQYSSLNEENMNKWYDDVILLQERIPAFLPFMNISDLRVFLAIPGLPRIVLASVKTYLEFYGHRRTGTYKAWIRDNLGAFRQMNDNNLDKDVKARTPYENPRKKSRLSTIQLDYLRKIINFCRDQKITLILLNTPVYEWRKFTDYRSYEYNSKKYLKDVRILDYADYPIEKKHFSDVSHLNKWGARAFSKYLEKNLALDLTQAQPQYEKLFLKR